MTGYRTPKGVTKTDIKLFSENIGQMRRLAEKSALEARAGEPEPGFFGSLEPEPEPLEKKTRSRSRLEKKIQE